MGYSGIRGLHCLYGYLNICLLEVFSQLLKVNFIFVPIKLAILKG